jgi:hypothetical protein
MVLFSDFSSVSISIFRVITDSSPQIEGPEAVKKGEKKNAYLTIITN